MENLSEGFIVFLFLWSFFGTLLFTFTFEKVNSKVKLPIWALICGPIPIVGTIIYWFIWTIHFTFFKERY